VLDVMMPTMNDWEVIDVLKRRITRAGVRITLTHKEFALLSCLPRIKANCCRAR
jgi:DNA-binding response OmpR family regulator